MLLFIIKLETPHSDENHCQNARNEKDIGSDRISLPVENGLEGEKSGYCEENAKELEEIMHTGMLVNAGFSGKSRKKQNLFQLIKGYIGRKLAVVECMCRVIEWHLIKSAT